MGNEQIRVSALRRRNPWRATVSILLGLFIGLALAEGIIRLSGADHRYMHKHMRLQTAEVACHENVFNPNLLYRLRPGAVCTDNPHQGHTYHINSLGVRGKERSAAKPPGTFRIICIGGSNTYGANVNDEETWPSRLEEVLNRGNGNKVEVWNMGTSAYVGTQMATIAKEALDRFDPDLIIFSLSNTGEIIFLENADLESYFQRYPEFWEKMLPGRYRKWIEFYSRENGLWLMNHFRVFRYASLALMEIIDRPKEPNWMRFEGGGCETRNVEAVRDFLSKSKDRVKTCVFIGPYAKQECVGGKTPYFTNLLYAPYYNHTAVPVFYLIFSGEPSDYNYTGIHPPASVYQWYAVHLAAWLVEKGLAPGTRPEGRELEGTNSLTRGQTEAVCAPPFPAQLVKGPDG